MNSAALRPPLFIEGISMWSQKLPGWERARKILAGLEAPAADDAPRPSPDLLAPTERRRAPDTVALAIDAGMNACRAAGRDPATLPGVFSSMHGDLAITDYMCATLASDPKLISPTKFHNSVHNAAAGYWSIGSGSTRPYTALSAGEQSFGAGLLEACVQCCVGREAILLVSYDIEARGPLASVAASFHKLAVGLVIADSPGPNTLARFDWTVTTGSASQPTAANAALVAGNSSESCLALMEALSIAGEHEVFCLATPNLGLRLNLEVNAA